MAHFYGTLKGRSGEATRCGTKNSGVRTVAASWAGAIEVEVYVDAQGRDCFRVSQIPWRGAGVREEIACGVIGEYTPERETQAQEHARLLRGE